MDVKDLKIGAKVTLKGNKEFRILDIRKESDKDYIVCSTNEKPILPIVFEYKQEGEKIKIRLEEDDEILKKIFAKMVKENS